MTGSPPYRRPFGEELAYVCDRLQAEETELLAKALRLGLLEIYKTVVLHELLSGRIDRREAARLVGSRVVDRSLAGRLPGTRGRLPGARRPAAARRPRAGRRPRTSARAGDR